MGQVCRKLCLVQLKMISSTRTLTAFFKLIHQNFLGEVDLSHETTTRQRRDVP